MSVPRNRVLTLVALAPVFLLALAVALCAPSTARAEDA